MGGPQARWRAWGRFAIQRFDWRRFRRRAVRRFLFRSARSRRSVARYALILSGCDECLSAESSLKAAQQALNTCQTYNDCGYWEESVNNWTCMVDECWNQDGGYCAADAS